MRLERFIQSNIFPLCNIINIIDLALFGIAEKYNCNDCFPIQKKLGCFLEIRQHSFFELTNWFLCDNTYGSNDLYWVFQDLKVPSHAVWPEVLVIGSIFGHLRQSKIAQSHIIFTEVFKSFKILCSPWKKFKAFWNLTKSGHINST